MQSGSSATELSNPTGEDIAKVDSCDNKIA